MYRKDSALNEDLLALQRLVEVKLLELTEAERQAVLQTEEAARLLALHARAGPSSPVPSRSLAENESGQFSPAQASSAAALAAGFAAALPPQHSAAFMAWMSSQPLLLVEGTAVVTDAHSRALNFPGCDSDVDRKNCEDCIVGLDAEDLDVDAAALAAAMLDHCSAAEPQQLSGE